MTALTERSATTSSRTNAANDAQLQEQDQQRRAIEQLAYALWQERGCPDGSAESDWLEAEQNFTQRSL